MWSTKNEVLQTLHDIKQNGMQRLYREDVVTQKDIIIPDSGELRTEIVAEFLLSYPESFETIHRITRRKSYVTSTHNGVFRNTASNRVEEHIAYELRNIQHFPDSLGEVLDYQIPLNSVRGDGAGAIDLISDDGSTLYLLELKRWDAKDTLLRCVLEILTYWLLVDRDKLVRDFLDSRAIRIVVPALLIFSESQQHQELDAHRPHLAALMDACDVRVFLLERTRDGYNCREYKRV